MASRTSSRRRSRSEPEASPAGDTPEKRGGTPELSLVIPPPRTQVSAIQRQDLASRWAADLGELAAELLSDGKLDVEPRPRASKATERK
jgi:hypothetical protein